MLRLCMLLKSLNNACDRIETVNETAKASDEERIALKDNINSDDFLIDELTVQRAIELTDFFNKSKLCLAAFNVQPNDQYDNTFANCFVSELNESSTSFETVIDPILKKCTLANA